jgi:hypothetical protein
MLYDEWNKRKLREKKLKEWKIKFTNASGNLAEQKKVYEDYLKSDIWKELRYAVLKRADGRCENCGALFSSNKKLDVHHKNYDRIGGTEKLEDLQALCSNCHKIADTKREEASEERRAEAVFRARVIGFAITKYGECWREEHNEADVEIELVMWLYEKYCRKMEFDFDPKLDPDTDPDFIEFWGKVKRGDY